MKTFRLEAHRGVGTEFPENTLPAFEASVNQGYDVIELDLKFTADNRCVVLHDGSIRRTGRTADGKPAPDTKITALTYAEADGYDYGLWKSEEFRGTRIPLFSDVLAFAKEKKIPLKIDNCYERFTAEQREILYSLIEKADMGNLVGFTCANAASFDEVAGRFPEAEFHYDGKINESDFSDLLSHVKNHRCTVWVPMDNGSTKWVHESIRRCCPELCELIHQNGLEVGVWILREQEELDYAKNVCGADIVETDGKLKP